MRRTPSTQTRTSDLWTSARHDFRAREHPPHSRRSPESPRPPGAPAVLAHAVPQPRTCALRHRPFDRCALQRPCANRRRPRCRGAQLLLRHRRRRRRSPAAHTARRHTRCPCAAAPPPPHTRARLVGTSRKRESPTAPRSKPNGTWRTLEHVSRPPHSASRARATLAPLGRGGAGPRTVARTTSTAAAVDGRQRRSAGRTSPNHHHVTI